MRVTLSQQDIAQLVVAHVRQEGFIADEMSVVFDIEELSPTGIVYAPNSKKNVSRTHRLSVSVEVKAQAQQAEPPL